MDNYNPLFHFVSVTDNLAMRAIRFSNLFRLLEMTAVEQFSSEFPFGDEPGVLTLVKAFTYTSHWQVDGVRGTARR